MELRNLANYLPSPLLHIAKRVHYRNTFANSTLADEPDLALLPELIKTHFACLDIGANLGIYSKHLAALSAYVLAFEPIRETFGYLKNNVRILPNVGIHNVAISDHIGSVSMTIPNIYEARITAESGDIPCLTIDSLNLDRCDFIKCDVEGHELAVVRGATGTIYRFHPIWLIESDWDSPLFAEMEQLGYECFIENKGSLRPRLAGERKTNYWFKDKGRC